MAKSILNLCLIAAAAHYRPLSRGRVSLKGVIHSDGWRGYNGLVDMGYKKHFHVQHALDEFVNAKSHINGIVSFAAYAKRRLAKFRGMIKSTFYLRLNECDFNYKDKNIYPIVRNIIKLHELF